MVFCYDRLSRQIQVSFWDGPDSNNGNKNFSCVKETSLFLHAHIHTLKFFFNYVNKNLEYDLGWTQKSRVKEDDEGGEDFPGPYTKRSKVETS